MNQLNPKWVLNDDDGFNRWEKFKPESELTLFEACNKLCFCDDLKIAHKINETLSFASRKFSEFFTDFWLVFMASDFEHKFFTLFDLLIHWVF
jgi:hypothetical protein